MSQSGNSEGRGLVASLNRLAANAAGYQSAVCGARRRWL